MDYQEYPPSLHLADFIKCYWRLEDDSSGAPGPPDPILPDGCMEIVFNLSDPFHRFHHAGESEKQPLSILVGQMSRYIMLSPGGRVRLFGVRFWHFGAAAFLPFPLSDIRDTIEGLAEVSGRAGLELEERINLAPDFRSRIRIIEDEFTKLLTKRRKADLAIRNVSSLILDSGGKLPVAKVARECGISERQMERRFLQSIGLSPKLFSRIIRLQGFLGALPPEGPASWAQAAIDSGYTDQSHLIRDFRDFAGTTPAAYFENRYNLTDFFISGQ